MTYLNLQMQETSVSATWNGSIGLTSLNLDGGISYKDQIEVERLFTLSDTIKSQISTYDLHRVFVVSPDYYTVDQGSAQITGFSLNGSQTYVCQKAPLVGQAITIPVVSSGDSVIVRRKTYSTAPYVSWVAGTRLTSAQLNKQVSQLLRLNQELLWKMDSEYVRKTDLTGTVSTNTFVITDNLDMANKFIFNLAMPATTTFGSNLTSAVTKGFLESNYVNMADTQAQTITGAKTFSALLTASAGIAGTLQSAAQPNITSVGTLTGLSVGGSVTVTGTATAAGFSGPLTGNASTATTLQTARTINGVSFNGSANITVPAAASTLTGSTLASNVTASSLTSVGTLTGLTLSSGTTGTSNIVTIQTSGLVVNANGLVGIGTASPGYRLDVAGSVNCAGVFATGLSVNGVVQTNSIVTKTASFTVGLTEENIICNAATAITATLPSAATSTGRKLYMKSIGAGVVNTASNYLNISNTAGTANLLSAAGKWVILVCDGTNWVVMAAN